MPDNVVTYPEIQTLGPDHSLVVSEGPDPGVKRRITGPNLENQMRQGAAEVDIFGGSMELTERTPDGAEESHHLFVGFQPPEFHRRVAFRRADDQFTEADFLADGATESMHPSIRMPVSDLNTQEGYLAVWQEAAAPVISGSAFQSGIAAGIYFTSILSNFYSFDGRPLRTSYGFAHNPRRLTVDGEDGFYFIFTRGINPYDITFQRPITGIVVLSTSRDIYRPKYSTWHTEAQGEIDFTQADFLGDRANFTYVPQALVKLHGLASPNFGRTRIYPALAIRASDVDGAGLSATGSPLSFVAAGTMERQANAIMLPDGSGQNVPFYVYKYLRTVNFTNPRSDLTDSLLSSSNFTFLRVAYNLPNIFA